MTLYQEKCNHCGHIKSAYSHRLNTSLVSALRKLVDEYQATLSPVLPKRLEAMGLTHCQIANFQKLQHFELIEMLKKGGGWLPTQKGLGFIFGNIPCVEYVISFENEILPLNHTAYYKAKKKPEYKYVWEINGIAYKKYDEYKSEKSAQTVLDIGM
jgi:hypothetical protein